MNIWIDGDACPRAIKQILFRAAIKRRVVVTIVANHLANTPASPFIKRVQVESGFDKADNYIALQLQNHDLVITADVILAAHTVAKNALALNPRGVLYCKNNIQQKLSVRNTNELLREGGLIKEGHDALSAKEIQNFSNQLDKILTQGHSA